jgi:hypothetical protein
MTTVETLVYSGRSNPTFDLDAAAEAEFANLVQQRMAGPAAAQRPATGLGYRGFAVTPPPALGLPPLLTVGQGLVVGETDGVTTAWMDTDSKCEEWLKQRASGAGQEQLVEPDRGDPVPPGVVRPQGRRLSLPEELLAAALDFARHILAEFEAAALVDVPSFAVAAGVPGYVDNGTVSAQLDTARTRLGLVAPSMAAGDFSGAARHIAVQLSAVDAAALKVGGLQLRDLVVKCVDWAGIHPLGLAQQLGLPGGKPDRLRIESGAVVFAMDAGAAALAPAPTLFGFDSATLEARLRADASQPAFSIGLSVKEAAVGIGAGPLAGLLGGFSGSVRADLALGVDSTHGLTLSGGATKKLVLPAHTGGGPLDIREIALEIPVDRSDTIQIGGAVAVKLGPMDATVEGAGLTLRIDPNAAASGESPLVVGLKAPTGIGLSLDTGIVRGGGFLDERSGGFGGALQLRVGPVEVDAFGLLTLKPAFALVVVMSVRFEPAIDLSFGFTLNAVGGVVGLEHRLDGDALAAQVATGALEHILFPPDAAAAAPSILHTLEQVFPVSRDSVVGPMLEVGWGRPVSFITGQIGVILSLPDPKIAIIGRGRVALPAPQLPIVDLRATVVGEVDSERFYMRVSLVGSRIAAYPVYGDLGMVMRWSGGAELALSAGGFHPRYSPPRELCDMRRLGMDMSPPAILRLRSESYFALTSNTVQLGARVDLSADLEVASIDGHFQFDGLVVYAPHFRFLADLGIGISVRAYGEQVGGISVQLHLEGPAPWRAEGHAEVDILFWTVPVDVGPFTWGDDTNPPPEPADPRQLVYLALHHNPGAWQTLVPPGADRVVHLKAAAPSDVDNVVHPMGLFEVRQRAVPLETVLARVGPNPVPDGQRRVHLGLPVVGAATASAVSEVTDLFAAGNFIDLSDDEKISRPGFEPMPAGARIRPPGESVDAAATRHAEIRYKTFVCDDDWMIGIHGAAIRDQFFGTSIRTALASGAAGASALRALRRYATTPDPIELADAGKVIQVSKSTVTMVPGTVIETYTHAAEHALDADVQLARVGVVA